jgi:hypothetical protein
MILENHLPSGKNTTAPFPHAIMKNNLSIFSPVTSSTRHASLRSARRVVVSLEHLGVYEEYLYWDVFYGQFTPQRPDLAEEVKGNDAEFLAYATDPNKGTSPWLAEPLGRFQSSKELIEYFNRFRNKLKLYLESTESDLRLHFTYRAAGSGIWTERDLHQHILIWVAHTSRHTDQIERIKSDPNFPNKSGILWSEEDRIFLLKNLERTKKEMILATEGLSEEQWHFKPSPESWSIAQVVEHIGLYERIVLQEARIAQNLPPQYSFSFETRSDSSYLAWMDEPNPHNAPANAVPLGFMDGKENLEFFTYGRNLLLSYVESTQFDLKAHYTPRSNEKNNRRSVHGLMVVHFGHTERHLRQIQRIKSDPNYP